MIEIAPKFKANIEILPNFSLSYDQFYNVSVNRKWSKIQDEIIIHSINLHSKQLNIDPIKFSYDLYLRVYEDLKTKLSFEDFYIRYFSLNILNRAAYAYVPFINFSRNYDSIFSTDYDGNVSEYNLNSIFDSKYTSTEMQLFMDIKRLVYSSVKIKLWKDFIIQTTTPTTMPSDEYERPYDIFEINLNMPIALDARQRKASLSFQEKVENSIFGQLLKSLCTKENSKLKRSYTHMQDAGQPRAFFVKFTEGVDDHGGPYRAAFETSLGEEVVDLLELFVECENAKLNVGENKDRVVINKSLEVDDLTKKLFSHLGRLIGIANR